MKKIRKKILQAKRFSILCWNAHQGEDRDRFEVPNQRDREGLRLVTTGKVIHTLKHDDGGNQPGTLALAFSPNGKLLATGHWHQVRLWDVAMLIAFLGPAP